jgi:Icc-related predicted phosphoesterase
MTLKIKVVSDLHLEFGDITIQNAEGADVLILSGDICIAEDLYDFPVEKYLLSDAMRKQSESHRKSSAYRYREFLKRVSADFPNVIYVAGNHEFYHGKWVKSLQVLRDECAKFENIHFLEMDSLKIDDVTFIGGTLWTDMNNNDPLTLHAVSGMLNDFTLIRNDDAGFTKLRPAHTTVRNRKMLEYIRATVESKPDEKYVIVGHHAPCRLSIHENYKSDYIMNGAYASDFSEFILDHPQIKLWTHGHMHTPSDYIIGETRIICNPRGYATEEHLSKFDPKLIVEV